MQNSHLKNLSNENIVIMKVFLATIFWAGTYVGGKLIAGEITPAIFGFFRFFIGSIALYYICKHRKIDLVFNKSNIFPLIILSLTGCVFFNLLLQLGLQTVSATRTSIIATTPPLFITIGAMILYKEKINGLQFLGVLISLLGAIIVISEGNISSMFTVVTRGDCYVLLSMLSWVVYVLLGKKLVSNISPIQVTTSMVMISAVIFTPLAGYDLLYRQNTFSPEVIFTCLFVGLFGTAASFVLFSDGVKVIGASRASVFLNLEAIFAVGLAILLLGESISSMLALGGIITFIGVYLTNTQIKSIPFLKRKKSS